MQTKNRMLAADSWKKNINVASKAVNVEARATFCDGEEPACEGKQDTHRERERERERDGYKEYVSIQGVQQLHNDNNLLKVTKSLYIVNHLGQLPLCYLHKWPKLGLSKGTV